MVLIMQHRKWSHVISTIYILTLLITEMYGSHKEVMELCSIY